MVTPTCYPPADVRRYGSRVATYPSYPDRRVNAYTMHAESRSSISEKDNMDDQTPQRKRIAVAVRLIAFLVHHDEVVWRAGAPNDRCLSLTAPQCGRCRKRKIRCSGDTGNGGPCSNCKSAGFEPCQFLRVCILEILSCPILTNSGCLTRNVAEE